MNFSELWERQDAAAARERILNTDTREVRRALALAGDRIGLREFEALISPAARGKLEQLAQISHELTVRRFGRTMQLYAPLYLSNACSNVCSYCGFSAGNRIPRKTLRPAEIEAEAAVLRRTGFDHILLVTGESAHAGVAYLEQTLQLLRPHFANLSLEVQPLETEDYVRLARAGASGVLVYQETYDPEAYARHHLRGPKTDMRWRMDTPDRLGQAGMHRIGLGALHGLSDWHTDSWFVALHLRHLESMYWRSKYSISFPRLRPHAGEAFQPAPFCESDLVQLACAFRILCPEAELALSTRESMQFRDAAMRLGFTHMSAGSRTNPGGYSAPSEEESSLEQFTPHDARGAADFVAALRRQGYEPLWKDWDPSFDDRTCEFAHVNASVTQHASR